MKALFGLLLIVGGVVFGVYVGVWVMLIGGIVQGVQAIVAVPFDAPSLAIGLCKFFLSGFAGYFAAFVLILPGAALLADS